MPTATTVDITPASTTTTSTSQPDVSSLIPNRNASLSLSYIRADLKDKRAYDLSRQRAHKPTDRLRAGSHVKELKVNYHSRRLWRVFGPADTEDRDLGNERHYDGLTKPLSDLSVDEEKPGSLILGELIETNNVRFRKQGGKKRKGLGKDVDTFELVPPLRSVIILDDLSFPSSLRPTPNDEWEYISSSSDDDETASVASSPSSYAQVLAHRQ